MNVGHLVLEPQGFNNSRLGHPAPSRSCKIARKMAKINIGSLFWLLLNDIVFFLFEKGGGGGGWRVLQSVYCEKEQVDLLLFSSVYCISLFHFTIETTI